MDVNEHTGGWDYTTLPSNVSIGAGCFLEDRDSFSRFRSTRVPGLVLGDRVRAYAWTTFSVEPSGFLSVGDDSVLVGPVFWCADRITIGKRVIISYNVTIADSDFHPRDPGLRRLDAIAVAPEGDVSQRPPIETRAVVIDDDVSIGIGAIILKGVHIGAGARIEAGTVVTRNVQAGAVVAGNPAQTIDR